MVDDSGSSPIFADRYRFEPVGDDWDRGRSGYTHLVYDLKEKRLGVIKRAELTVHQAIKELSNEARALTSLKGLGVANIYDSGQTIYGSKNYNFIVIEYIDGIRVEKHLNSLTTIDRAEIITKLFRLLSESHEKGIVNGDIDIKHLFWRKKDRQLIVIDWGNAKHGIDTRKKTEFAYDLARAAEIIYSLVTRQGHHPATGSLALPDDSSAIIPGLHPLPEHFRNLCKWAPRTPSDGAQAPYTAQELYEVSEKWLLATSGSNPPSRENPPSKGKWLTWSLLLLITAGAFFGIKYFLPISHTISPTPSNTSTAILLETPSKIPSTTIISTETKEVATERVMPTGTLTATITQTPTETSSPGSYSPIKIFNDTAKLDEFLISDEKLCWLNEVFNTQNPDTQSPEIIPISRDGFSRDGFYRRTDNYWGFNVGINFSTQDVVQVDFSNCLSTNSINAFALNFAVQRLDIPAYEPAREFGVFLVNQEGLRREYTLWLDKSEAMYLRVREDNHAPNDYQILVVSSSNLHSGGQYPRPYKQFPVQLFVEIDNNGSDIIYLLEGQFQSPIQANAIDPNQMILIEAVRLSTLKNIQKIGLVGYGGKTEILIWPLVFLESISE